MSTVVINSQAGSNGVLHLTVPLGLENANQDVQVTVESVNSDKVSFNESGRGRPRSH